jgi:hypothetical protein
MTRDVIDICVVGSGRGGGGSTGSSRHGGSQVGKFVILSVTLLSVIPNDVLNSGSEINLVASIDKCNQGTECRQMVSLLRVWKEPTAT